MSKPDYLEVVSMLELVIGLYDDTKTPEYPNGRGVWEKARDVLRRAKIEPTAEGRRRWEPDGHYDGEPCTCKPECPQACKGGCGCDACRTAYSDQCGELGCE